MNITGNKYRSLINNFIKVFIFIGVFCFLQLFIWLYFKKVNPSGTITPFFSFSIDNTTQLFYSLTDLFLRFIFAATIAFNNFIKVGILKKIKGKVKKIDNGKILVELENVKKYLDRSKNLDMVIDSNYLFLTLSNNRKLDIFETLLILEEAKIFGLYSLASDSHTLKNCIDNLFTACKHSKEILISGIAQYEFIGKYFNEYIESERLSKKEKISEDNIFFKILLVNKNIKMRVLIIDPYKPEVDKIIAERIKQIGKVKLIDDNAIKKYKYEILLTIQFLELLKKDGFDINYKLFNDEPIFRYNITDNKLFFSQYVRRFEGHESLVFEIEKADNSLYESFCRLFTKRWERFYQNSIS